MGANVKLAGAMTTATQSLTTMNKVLNPQKLSHTMQEFGKASAKMDMTEEMINDALDDILNESGDEEASENIVQEVLDEIGIDISSKVSRAPAAPSKLSATERDEMAELEKQLAKLKG